jgi:hypothetical protein
MKKMQRLWTRLARHFALPQRPPAVPGVEPLEDIIAPANLWWYPKAVLGGYSTNMSDPTNYWNLDTDTRNTAQTFATSDVLNFKYWTAGGTNWDTSGTFQSSVKVNSLVINSNWSSSSDPHTIGLANGVSIDTVGFSQLNDPYATISMGAAALVELVGSSEFDSGSYWSAGTIYGGTLLCDNGWILVNPAQGGSVACNTFLDIKGGGINYEGAGNLNLQGNGKITVENSGTLFCCLQPVPVGYNGGQTIQRDAGNNNNVTVTSGTFEVNDVGPNALVCQLPVSVNGANGVLRVDSGTYLQDVYGVNASAGAIWMEGGSRTTIGNLAFISTVIDTGSAGLTLSGQSSLLTINNTATNRWAQVTGKLTVGANATVWIGEGLNASVGAVLNVAGDVDISGTLEIATWLNNPPTPPQNFSAGQLTTTAGGNVTFEAGAALALDQHNGNLPSQSGFVAVDTSGGGGTITLNGLGNPTGWTLGLNGNSNQLFVTKN